MFPKSEEPIQQIVLVDDDVLVRLTWEASAKKKDLNFTTFKNSEELMNGLHLIDKNACIYLDSNLGDGNHGEFVAKHIYELGYKNLFIASGYGKEHFENINWIKGVIGKAPPF